MDKISNVNLCVGANLDSFDRGRKKIFPESECVDKKTQQEHEEMQQLSMAVQQLMPLDVRYKEGATSSGVYIPDDLKDKPKSSKRDEIASFNSLHGAISSRSKNGYHARLKAEQVSIPSLRLDPPNDGLNVVDSGEMVKTKNKDSNSYGHEIRSGSSHQSEKMLLPLPLQEKFSDIYHQFDKSVTNLIDEKELQPLPLLGESDKLNQFSPQLQVKDKAFGNSLHKPFTSVQSQSEPTTIFGKEAEQYKNGELIYSFKAWGDQHAVRIALHPSQNHAQLLLRPSSNLVEQRLNDQVASSCEKWIVEPHQDDLQDGAKHRWIEEEDEL
ncbi:hypothetical protein QN379_22650 [Glaciimonas sp. Gout2]|uniref:SpaN/EivJ family type III secretion system needle length determinant n=1 Tax=unclassified Glaciimonas TaxID=2644401 RepID=UPI002B23055E|nr:MULTISPECIES: hypothetical protein [unclassified Glaciimonas]MEB0010292.1 hypothetical protein [Glaciimonas sp. Cout2]MEB0084813.1 hypothetical protein [Glaciimonas sp. Gout2]